MEIHFQKSTAKLLCSWPSIRQPTGSYLKTFHSSSYVQGWRSLFNNWTQHICAKRPSCLRVGSGATIKERVMVDKLILPCRVENCETTWSNSWDSCLYMFSSHFHEMACMNCKVRDDPGICLRKACAIFLTSGCSSESSVHSSLWCTAPLHFWNEREHTHTIKSKLTLLPNSKVKICRI